MSKRSTWVLGFIPVLTQEWLDSALSSYPEQIEVTTVIVDDADHTDLCVLAMAKLTEGWDGKKECTRCTTSFVGGVGLEHRCYDLSGIRENSSKGWG